MEKQFDGFLLKPDSEQSRASTGGDDEDTGEELRSAHSVAGTERRRMHAPRLSALGGAPGMNNSITMTPTTQFLEQPVLFNVKKGGPPPGAPSATGGASKSNTPLDDLLVELNYAAPPMLFTCLAGAVGFALGAVINKAGLSTNVKFWIGMPGYLFISAIECLTLPLIFTTVTMGFANLIMSKKTKGVNVRVLVFFFGAALLASLVALAVAYSFAAAGAFARKPDPTPELASATLSLMCPNGLYLAVNSSLCTGKQLRDAMKYVATNITGVPLDVAGAPTLDTPFATQIVTFFDNLVTQNIAETFSSSAFLAATLFSVLFGAGVVLAHDPTTGEPNHVFVLVKQIDVVLELILNWLMPWTPFGTLSAMTYYISVGSLTQDTFSETLAFSLAVLTALLAYFALVTCIGYWLLVRKNPLSFFLYLLPAMIFIFGSSNYTATIPVLMRCIEGSKQISRTLAQYTVSVGVSFCLPGTAAFFVVATLFMAYSSGVEHVLTPGRVIGLVLVSTLSSFGVPHESGASLSYLATIWLTIFPAPLPPSFVLLMWIEWLIVRMRRTHNIVMIAFIARVIAEQLDETVEDEEDRAFVDRPVGLAHM